MAQPRLSWVLRPSSAEARSEGQTAYRVLVASTPQLLRDDMGDLWDSGKVSSDETIHIVYSGKRLASRMAGYWKVCVWDRTSHASSWSDPAMWSMGLLDKSEWRGHWISDPNSSLDAATQARAAQAAHFGYRSYYSASENAEKWVVIDLGGVQRIDAVRLYAATDPCSPANLGGSFRCVYRSRPQPRQTFRTLRQLLTAGRLMSRLPARRAFCIDF